jgi:hypothetical protein
MSREPEEEDKTAHKQSATDEEKTSATASTLAIVPQPSHWQFPSAHSDSPTLFELKFSRTDRKVVLAQLGTKVILFCR